MSLVVPGVDVQSGEDYAGSGGGRMEEEVRTVRASSRDVTDQFEQSVNGKRLFRVIPYRRPRYLLTIFTRRNHSTDLRLIPLEGTEATMPIQAQRAS